MTFKILDKDGTPVTKYENLSEAVTYWQHSAGPAGPKFDREVRENEITVFDSAGNEVGAISVPKGDLSDADKQTMGSLFPADSPNGGPGGSGSVSGNGRDEGSGGGE